MGYKHIKIPKEGSKIKLSDGIIQVPDNPIIPYIEGDGIGIDITPAMLDVSIAQWKMLIKEVKKYHGWKFTVVKNLQKFMILIHGYQMKL